MFWDRTVIVFCTGSNWQGNVRIDTNMFTNILLFHVLPAFMSNTCPCSLYLSIFRYGRHVKDLLEFIKTFSSFFPRVNQISECCCHNPKTAVADHPIFASFSCGSTYDSVISAVLAKYDKKRIKMKTCPCVNRNIWQYVVSKTIRPFQKQGEQKWINKDVGRLDVYQN